MGGEAPRRDQVQPLLASISIPLIRSMLGGGINTGRGFCWKMVAEIVALDRIRLWAIGQANLESGDVSCPPTSGINVLLLRNNSGGGLSCEVQCNCAIN